MCNDVVYKGNAKDKWSSANSEISDCALGIGNMDEIQSHHGALHYMAPEMIREDSYTRSVDWWALGVIIYQMLVGKVSAQ